MRGNLIGRTSEASDRGCNWQEADSQAPGEKVKRMHQNLALRKSGGVWTWEGDELVSKYPSGPVRDESEANDATGTD